LTSPQQDEIVERIGEPFHVTNSFLAPLARPAPPAPPARLAPRHRNAVTPARWQRAGSPRSVSRDRPPRESGCSRRVRRTSRPRAFHARRRHAGGPRWPPAVS
jgi:hypothetical protein